MSRNFVGRERKKANKYMKYRKRCLHTLITRAMQIKTIVRYEDTGNYMCCLGRETGIAILESR